MGIYAYCGERRVTVKVSSKLMQSLTRKEKEKLRCFAASILAFVGIACVRVIKGQGRVTIEPNYG